MSPRTVALSAPPVRHPLLLARGSLRRRYKRFLADVVLDDGVETTVHCPNSGSMMGLDAPGIPIVVSDSGDSKRKLRRTLESVQVDDGGGRTWVGVNTMLPNRFVADWIPRGLFPGVPADAPLRREVAYGTKSRIDLLVSPEDAPPVYIEVKNTTLATTGRDGRLEARFPDAVTERGQKHLRELMVRVAAGDRGLLVPFVNRHDCVRFAPADDIDPVYGDLLREAVEAGVEVSPLQVRHSVRRTTNGTILSTRPRRFLPVRL
ncbi:MAG: DNA/RNA nuclease SfsA [Euryarchaeota archaeon]|nr:DNA/RNA nuclease SfsA [Euryarchaeota archaeon]